VADPNLEPSTARASAPRHNDKGQNPVTVFPHALDFGQELIEHLRAAFGMRRLVRRGLPIRTPTYEIGEHMIWGATARILSELLERLPLD
jgi:hypothetical protein